MPNMSYCRFENTLNDLRDCYQNMDSDDVSQREFYKRKQLLELCISISKEYEHLLDLEYEEDIDED
jgi:hypothetical protein